MAALRVLPEICPTPGIGRRTESGLNYAGLFEERGQFRFAEARNDAWAHPVILNGRLYLRYHDRLTCFDVKPKKPAVSN